MVQAYGVAAAIGHPINMHYPEVNQCIHPFMNTTVQPLESGTVPGTSQSEIQIVWSSTTLPATLIGTVRLNHFVPLLPRSLLMSPTKRTLTFLPLLSQSLAAVMILTTLPQVSPPLASVMLKIEVNLL